MRLVLLVFGILKRSLVELLIRREILRPKDYGHMTKKTCLGGVIRDKFTLG